MSVPQLVRTASQANFSSQQNQDSHTQGDQSEAGRSASLHSRQASSDADLFWTGSSASLTPDQTALLDSLLSQLAELKPPLANKVNKINALFKAIKNLDNGLKSILQYSPGARKLGAVQSRLSDFFQDFHAALISKDAHRKINPVKFDRTMIQEICQGLSVCVPVSGTRLLNRNRFEKDRVVLQAVTDILLERALSAGLPDSVQANGEVLDILNWISRGMKAGLLDRSDRIKSLFTQSLPLFVAWTSGKHCERLITDHNLGKCAVQLAMMCNQKLISLDEANVQMLAQCAHNFCSPAVLAWLCEFPVDPVPILNISNAIKDFMDERVLSLADPALAPVLSRLVKVIGSLSAGSLIPYGVDCKPLSSFSNFLRTLAEHLANHPALPADTFPELDRACRKLIDCINSPAFAAAEPDSVSLSNLVSFVKICDKRLQLMSSTTSTATTTTTTTTTTTKNLITDTLQQSDLVNAAGKLMSWLIDFGAGDFTKPNSISGLLAGLAYLWQRNLVMHDEAGKALMQALLNNAGDDTKSHWEDPSRKVLLPVVRALIMLDAIDINAVQPALQKILNRPGRVRLNDLTQEISDLGTVEEVVTALPPVIASLTKLAPALPEKKEKIIPGLTRILPSVDATKTKANASTMPLTPTTAMPKSPASSIPADWQQAVRVTKKGKSSSAITSPILHEEPELSTRQSVVEPEAKTISKPVQNNNQPQKTQPPKKKKSNTSAAGVQAKSKPAILPSSQSALLRAITTGKPESIKEIMLKAGVSREEDVVSLLDAVFEEIDLIDRKIVSALANYLDFLIAENSDENRKMLKKYFDAHPPQFDAVKKMLEERQLSEKATVQIATKSVPAFRRVKPVTVPNPMELNFPEPRIIFDSSRDRNKFSENMLAQLSNLFTSEPESFQSTDLTKLKAFDLKKQLTIAAAVNDIKKVKEILKLSTIVENEKYKLLAEALIIASEKGHHEIAREIINCENGRVLSYQSAVPFNFLQTIALKGDGENLQRLLNYENGSLIKSYDKNVGDPGMATLAMLAVQGKRLDTLRVLMNYKQGELMRTTTNVGWNALTMAAYFGHLDMITLLLEFDNGSLARQPDNKGKTPLQYAREQGKTEAVALLSKFK